MPISPSAAVVEGPMLANGTVRTPIARTADALVTVTISISSTTALRYGRAIVSYNTGLTNVIPGPTSGCSACDDRG